MRHYLSILWIIFFTVSISAQAPDTLWTKIFGGTGDDEGRSVQQTTDGGYIIAGTTQSFGANNNDVWLIKTDANGDSLWSRTFGGDGQDQGSSVQQTSDSGYIIVGITDPLNGHYKDFDIYLIKTDANGDTLWTKTFGERYDDDWGFSIGQTMDNGYIITGRTDPYGPIGYNLWLIKVASDITQIGGDFTAIINEYHLLQNSPNPFNPTTTISYQLPVGGKAELSIFNLLGQQIRTIVNSDQPVGEHQVQWDGRDDLGKQVSSGIYFYKLKAGNDFSETKKMILVR